MCSLQPTDQLHMPAQLPTSSSRLDVQSFAQVILCLARAACAQPHGEGCLVTNLDAAVHLTGYDAATNTNDLRDTEGHGTHVTGKPCVTLPPCDIVSCIASLTKTAFCGRAFEIPCTPWASERQGVSQPGCPTNQYRVTRLHAGCHHDPPRFQACKGGPALVPTSAACRMHWQRLGKHRLSTEMDLRSLVGQIVSVLNWKYCRFLM